MCLEEISGKDIHDIKGSKSGKIQGSGIQSMPSLWKTASILQKVSNVQNLPA
jgi:hypothetical protein